MDEMEKSYSPEGIEDKWYKFWEDNNYFHGEVNEGEPKYSIVIPPPNVTGFLHMGHVLNNSIQDTIIRWKRMQGYNAMWMPGCDHAGIATQNKVERALDEEGLKKEDIGREEFIKRVWEWKEKHGGIITQQLRKLGASLDWERERFTMDEGLSDAVDEIFVRLFKDDLIYRGEYIINWCPHCKTAISDDEVDHKDLGSYIWNIKYPIKDSDEYIIIATTRPETILGDTAVAVNPNDDRYKHLINKKVILPLMEKEIPIIEDEYVDMEFGTGALKITPAHDPNDFEVGKRHNLEIVNILNEDGTLNDNAGEYKYLDRFEVREQILADLEERKLLVDKKTLNHAVGHCYRCNTVIEPRVSNQWFVRMEPMAKDALKVVKEKEILLAPKRWEKVYYNWLENIRDWCISRQIWWGHRIPAYYCNSCHEIIVSKDTPDVCPKCGHDKFTQETDVLDTWFSSWLWPFSTLGWPEKTKELEYFYPTDLLVTGGDIIFFWVARMIMAGEYALDEIPFKQVFLHGIVRDKQGRKMSKTLGNSPNPLDIIAEFGADSLRFSMLYNTSQGQDVFYSNKLIEMGRNFCNKIWNASRFVLMNFEGFSPDDVDLDNLQFELADNWIFSRLNKTIIDINRNLDKYYIDEAAKTIYDFLWKDFCDWYIEISKDRLYNPQSMEERQTTQFVLWYVLEQGLRLLHPFMPFITEEIWHKVPDTGESIMISDYPEADDDLISAISEKDMAFIQDVIRAIRNIRTDMNINPGKKIEIIAKSSEGQEQVIIEQHKSYILKLTNTSNMEVGCDGEKPEKSATKVINNTEIFVLLEGIIDIESEKKRLTKDIEKSEKDKLKTEKKLNNKIFLEKAPNDVIEKEKKKLDEFQRKLSKLKENLEVFG